MKKLLTYLLTFAMLIVVLIPAMEPASAAAAGSETLQGDIKDSTRQIPVYATVDAPMIADVFYVELSWGSMLFEIKDTGSRSYDPEKMENVYEPNVTVEPAEAGANEFRMENKSNYPIGGDCTFYDDSAQLEGTFTGDVGDANTFYMIAGTAEEEGDAIRTADITLNLAATEDFKMESTTPEEEQIGRIVLTFRRST